VEQGNGEASLFLLLFSIFNYFGLGRRNFELYKACDKEMAGEDKKNIQSLFMFFWVVK